MQTHPGRPILHLELSLKGDLLELPHDTKSLPTHICSVKFEANERKEEKNLGDNKRRARI